MTDLQQFFIRQREELGYSIETLAQYTGIEPSLLKSIEDGSETNPRFTIQEMKILCSIFIHTLINFPNGSYAKKATPDKVRKTNNTTQV